MTLLGELGFFREAVGGKDGARGVVGAKRGCQVLEAVTGRQLHQGVTQSEMGSSPIEG